MLFIYVHLIFSGHGSSPLRCSSFRSDSRISVRQTIPLQAKLGKNCGEMQIRQSQKASYSGYGTNNGRVCHRLDFNQRNYNNESDSTCTSRINLSKQSTILSNVSEIDIPKAKKDSDKYHTWV